MNDRSTLLLEHHLKELNLVTPAWAKWTPWSGPMPTPSRLV